MKSIWEIHYNGPHARAFSKKLARLLGVKIVEVLSERYVSDGRKIERIVTEMEHDVNSWDELVSNLISLSSKITPQWKVVTTDNGKRCFGLVDADERDEKGGYEIFGPSDFIKLSWLIDKNERYSISKLNESKEYEW